jgi:hypothetical protein
MGIILPPRVIIMTASHDLEAGIRILVDEVAMIEIGMKREMTAVVAGRNESVEIVEKDQNAMGDAE